KRLVDPSFSFIPPVLTGHWPLRESKKTHEISEVADCKGRAARVDGDIRFNSAPIGETCRWLLVTFGCERLFHLTVKNVLFYEAKLGLRNPLRQQLGTNGLKVTSESPPVAVQQTTCKDVKDRSAVIHPSSSHARRSLIRFLLVKRLESEAVTDLTPGIWRHVPLKRSKNVGDEEAQNELFTSFRYQRHLDYKI
ncbi:hypothetical protein J6590_102166, partial [Homalodisca vitripennis]